MLSDVSYRFLRCSKFSYFEANESSHRTLKVKKTKALATNLVEKFNLIIDLSHRGQLDAVLKSEAMEAPWKNRPLESGLCVGRGTITA